MIGRTDDTLQQPFPQRREDVQRGGTLMSWSDGATKHTGTRDGIAAEDDGWLREDRVSRRSVYSTSGEDPMIPLSLI